jgi:hypothetical protein
LYDQYGIASKGLQNLLTNSGVIIEGPYHITNINRAIYDAGWAAPPGVERCDLQLPEKLKCKEDIIIDICHSDLKMGKAILPCQSKYDALLFLGASFSRVVNRAKFLWNMAKDRKLDANHEMWILTGVRSLNNKAGETIEVMSKISPAGMLSPAPTNEYEVIKYVFVSLGIPSGIKVRDIYSEIEEGYNRATTFSTMEAFLNLADNRKGSSFAAISNQPYVTYQLTALELALQKSNRSDVTIEVIGDQASIPADKGNYAATLLDTVGKTSQNLEKLGTFALDR